MLVLRSVIFLIEMSKLPDLPSSNSKKGRRQKRKSKPFWNQELNDLWVIRCDKEKMYSDFPCNNRHDLHQKEILRNQFKVAQTNFDKKFRFFKRLHNSGKFKNLENCADKDPSEMWKILKSLSEPKSNRVIMEIVNNDETISTDIKEILERWHSDISGLFSGLRDDPGLAFDDLFLQQISDLKNEFENLSNSQQQNASNLDSTAINSEFSTDEVNDAIIKSKQGKSYLDIPNEALKNEAAKKLLHRFFNICFLHGLSPMDWDFSDIKPIPK